MAAMTTQRHPELIWLSVHRMVNRLAIFARYSFQLGAGGKAFGTSPNAAILRAFVAGEAGLDIAHIQFQRTGKRSSSRDLRHSLRLRVGTTSDRIVATSA